LAFVREWFGLLEPFSRRATPEMWNTTSQMYADMDNWGERADPGFSKKVWDFISAAASKAREAGKDMGPVPCFMGSQA
jgi:hypothetical protein